MLLDKQSGKFILYEFEDLDRDGNVEVCVSGDPERKIKVYTYFSREHAEQINRLTGFSLGANIGYSSKGNVGPSINSELIIMDKKQQEEANYLFSIAK